MVRKTKEIQQLSDEQIARRMERGLKRSLIMKPTPHKTKRKGGKATSRRTSVKRANAKKRGLSA